MKRRGKSHSTHKVKVRAQNRKGPGVFKKHEEPTVLLLTEQTAEPGGLQSMGSQRVGHDCT